MRFRPLASLSVAAATILLIAGCSAPAPQTSETPDAATDLCAAVAPSGEASDAVSVEGEQGVSATVNLDSPLDITAVERSVVTEGDGDELADGDYVTYGLTAFDPASGEQLGSVGYGEATLPPQQISAESALGQLFGCAPVGSRLVATLPSSGQGEAQIYVLDVLDATPEAEWCQPEDFTGEAPSVAFGDGGRPTVTIPETAEPEAVSIEVLTEGDGETVEPGASVEVNYEGVKWSDGTVFDSSWEAGQPASFTTDGVVAGFQRALEGQKVGSTILVSMPPLCGYGETASEQSPLGGETLVFVLEILGTGPTEG